MITATHEATVVRLTTMQHNVLGSLCEGKNTAQIGADWGITRNTVKVHLRELFARTGARDRVQLVALVHSGAIRCEPYETTRRIEL